MEYAVHGAKLTWGSPWFAVAQLSTAVRATCVHAAIMQQERWVLPSTSYFFQAPATEHVTVSGLKHGGPVNTDTQLSIFCIPPTKHVDEGRGDEHQSEGAVRGTARWRMITKYSGFRAAPLSPLHIKSNPGKKKYGINFIFIN